MDPNLMAPCGINCATCSVHLRAKAPCPGCHSADAGKPKHCVVCAIKHCAQHAGAASPLCFACGKFPCARLKRLDSRYRANYGLSLIENLRAIETLGLAKFMAREARRWRCARCGQPLSVHHATCLACGAKR